MSSAVKVFKDSVTNKTSWMITLGIFSCEAAVLTYQRYISKTVPSDLYQTKLKASFFSNVAGILGGSLGAANGTFIGNLIILLE